MTTEGGAFARIGRHEGPVGRRFAFAGDGRWAAAGVGEVHLWEGDRLTASVGVPGYVDGAPCFDPTSGLLRVGTSVVTAAGTEPIADAGKDLFVAGLDEPSASYPERFGARVVEWAPDVSCAAVVVQYHKPAGRPPAKAVPAAHRVLLVDGRLRRVLAVLEDHVGEVELTAAAVSHDHVTVTSEHVALARLPDAVERVVLHGPGGPGGGHWRTVAFSPDGQLLAAGGDPGVAVWDTGGALRASVADGADPVTALAWHPDGQRIAAGTRGGQVTLLGSNGARLAVTRTDPGVAGLGFAPDGRLLVATSPPDPAIVVMAVSD